VKTKEAIQEEEEHIRKLVRELPDEKRLLFFQQAEKELKDPDTYAALNALFVAGLHHFYLGQWVRGAINLFIFVAGMVFLFAGHVAVGIGLLIAISLVELKALFAAQIVVQDYNNAVMEKIYRVLIKD
jgi:TM2 domain-containing membrane protein YozV